MVQKINIHTNKIENELFGIITEAEKTFNHEIKKTIDVVKDENKKVYALLEQLKVRVQIA